MRRQARPDRDPVAARELRAGERGRVALALACHRAYETGDEVVVTYEAERADGTRFRNTEVMTFAGDRLTNVEVYFGWNLRRPSGPRG